MNGIPVPALICAGLLIALVVVVLTVELIDRRGAARRGPVSPPSSCPTSPGRRARPPKIRRPLPT